MLGFIIGLVLGAVVGFIAAIPYWWRRMKHLHAQWIMFCDQVVNEKILEFFGGQRTDDGAIIIPVHVVKPPKTDGEAN